MPDPTIVAAFLISVFQSLFNPDPTVIVKTVMDAVGATPLADLKLGAFASVYAKVIAFVVLAGIFAFFWHLFAVAARNNREDTAISGLAGSVKLFMGCILLPGIVTAIALAADQLMTGVKAAAGPSESWTSGLNPSTQGLDKITALLLAIVGWIVQLILQFEVAIAQYGVYIAVLLLVISLVVWVIRGKLGGFSQFCISFLITCLLLRPAIIAVLAFSGNIIGGMTGTSNSAKAWMIFGVFFFCIIMFGFVFWFTNKKVTSFVENRVNVVGRARVTGNVTTSGKVSLTEKLMANIQSTNINHEGPTGFGQRMNQLVTGASGPGESGESGGAVKGATKAMATGAIAKFTPPQVQVGLAAISFLSSSKPADNGKQSEQEV